MIGIICALKVELEGLIQKMDSVKTTQKAKLTFYSGKIFDKEIVAVECGVGKVNAAMCTQLMIDLFAPSQIINSGIAGALSDKTEIGDIVICRDVVQHDMDGTALGDPPGLLSFNDCNLIEINADKEIISKLENACKNVENTKYETGRIATGDIFVSAREHRRKINELFNAIACEMEGGAIAQVCFRNEIPFGITRAISDSMNENEGVDFFKFRDSAAAQSIKILCEFLKQ